MMASITNVWDARFSLFPGLLQTSRDSVAVRGLKKRSQEAISRAAYLCAEEQQERCGIVGSVANGDRDFIGLTSLFPARDQVGTFIGFSDRDGRAEDIGEGREFIPLLRVGSASHYIGLAAILDERDCLRGEVRSWEEYDAERMDDLNWLTERGGCGSPDDWSGPQDIDCEAVRMWDEWREKCPVHGGWRASNWWELVDFLDTAVSMADRRALGATRSSALLLVERDNALAAGADALAKMIAEVETQKVACRNSWAAQEERDESAMDEIGRLAAEKEALKKKVEALEKDLEMTQVKLNELNESRMEAADACLAIQKKNCRLQEAIKVILSAGEEVYEEDE